MGLFNALKKNRTPAPNSSTENTSSHLDKQAAKADKLIEQGDTESALGILNKIIREDPTHNLTHLLMAKAIMPGAKYETLLKQIHQKLIPSSYAEIGVCTGKSLALANENTHCVGIDPNFRILESIVAKARLYPITSDAFFSRYDLLKELESDTLDLAFIDGLHLFEQALKDFINLEKYACESTVILVHDCYPATKAGAQRKRITGYWAGDVWKVIPCLKQFRPDLKIYTIPTFPSGLSVITRLDPTSSVLDEQFEAAINQYIDYPYKNLVAARDDILNVGKNDWNEIVRQLPTT